MAKRVVSLAGRVIVQRALPTLPRVVIVSPQRVVIDPCGPVIVPVLRVIVPCGFVVIDPRVPVIGPVLRVIVPGERVLNTSRVCRRLTAPASRLPMAGGERWQGEAAAPAPQTFTER